MSANRPVLSVIPIRGLRQSSLGAYLAALGLLKVLSRSLARHARRLARRCASHCGRTA